MCVRTLGHAQRPTSLVAAYRSPPYRHAELDSYCRMRVSVWLPRRRAIPARASKSRWFHALPGATLVHQA